MTPEPSNTTRNPLHIPRQIRQVLLVIRTEHSFARAIVGSAVRYGYAAAERWLFSPPIPDDGLQPGGC